MKILKKPTASLIADIEHCPREAYLKSFWLDANHSFSLLESLVMHSLAADAIDLTLNYKRNPKFILKVKALLNEKEARSERFVSGANLEECIEEESKAEIQRKILDFENYNSLSKDEAKAQISKDLVQKFNLMQEDWIYSSIISLAEIANSFEDRKIKVFYLREYEDFKSIYSDRLSGRFDGIVFFKEQESNEIKVAPLEIKSRINPRAIVQNAAYHILIKEKFESIKKLFEKNTFMNPKNLSLSNDLWFFEYNAPEKIAVFPAKQFEEKAEKNISIVNGWIFGNKGPEFKDHYSENSFKCRYCFVREGCIRQPDKISN